MRTYLISAGTDSRRVESELYAQTQHLQAQKKRVLSAERTSKSKVEARRTLIRSSESLLEASCTAASSAGGEGDASAHLDLAAPVGVAIFAAAAATAGASSSSSLSAAHLDFFCSCCQEQSQSHVTKGVWLLWELLQPLLEHHPHRRCLLPTSGGCHCSVSLLL